MFGWNYAVYLQFVVIISVLFTIYSWKLTVWLTTSRNRAEVSSTAPTSPIARSTEATPVSRTGPVSTGFAWRTRPTDGNIIASVSKVLSFYCRNITKSHALDVNIELLFYFELKKGIFLWFSIFILSCLSRGWHEFWNKPFKTDCSRANFQVNAKEPNLLC